MQPQSVATLLFAPWLSFYKVVLCALEPQYKRVLGEGFSERFPVLIRHLSQALGMIVALILSASFLRKSAASLHLIVLIC